MVLEELRGHLRAATPLSKRDHLEDAPIAVGLDVDGVAVRQAVRRRGNDDGAGSCGTGDGDRRVQREAAVNAERVAQICEVVLIHALEERLRVTVDLPLHQEVRDVVSAFPDDAGGFVGALGG